MRGTATTRTADVVIIGGGIMGASIAYHVARRRAGRVMLLERADMFGTGSTGANAGGMRHQFSTAVNIELSRLSIAMMERFPEEMHQEVDLNFCGYLFLLDNEADMAVFRRNVALQHRLGVPTRLLNPDDIRELAPLFRLDDIVGGTFYDRDGLADPSGALQGYLAQARALGAELRTGEPVTAIRSVAGRVTGVSTSAGEIDAPVVVIAAGPWSGEVGKLAGIDLPVQPVRRQIAVTRPIPGIDRSFPFTIDFTRSLYFHYESGGILTGMSDPDQPPGFDTSVDPDWRLAHIEQAVNRLPLLETAEILTEWAGLYEVTPDDQPILGRLPQLDGLFACTGFSGHGFMQGPASGLVIAEEIVDGRAHTIDIDPLRWDRFEKHAAVAEYNVI
ncbi:MAG: FAD-binding oxidoreductase [Gemmatimonadetes bacterium]|nr:FAD-binding oxidoreductase [Gemmatimonadota bacterium]